MYVKYFIFHKKKVILYYIPISFLKQYYKLGITGKVLLAKKASV